MKKLIFLVFILPLFILQGCKPADQITLHVTVSDDVCQSGQWVYWFSINGNENNIEDSLYLAKGQHSFTMKKVIPEMNDYMGSWLTFAKHGPQQAFLLLMKGENVKLIINKRGITKTEGSPGTQEWYDYIHKILNIRKKIDTLADVLGTTKDSLVQRQLVDSINYLQDSLDTKLLLYDFKNLKSPKMFLLLLRISHGLPQKKVDSLVKVMKQHFPNDKSVQEYPRHPKFRLPTPHSDWVQSRLQQIWDKRTGPSSKRPVLPKL